MFCQHDSNSKTPNLNLFKYPFPSCLGIDDEFIPNAVLGLQFMPASLAADF